jgi:hypothetical protein
MRQLLGREVDQGRDKGVLPTLCTRCETRKGPFASEQKDSGDKENREGINGEEEEEEILFQRLRKKRRKVPLTWRRGQSS